MITQLRSGISALAMAPKAKAAVPQDKNDNAARSAERCASTAFRRWLDKNPECKQSYLEIKDRKLQTEHRRSWQEKGPDVAAERILKTRTSQDSTRSETKMGEKTIIQLVRLLGKAGAKRHVEMCKSKGMIREDPAGRHVFVCVVPRHCFSHKLLMVKHANASMPDQEIYITASKRSRTLTAMMSFAAKLPLRYRSHVRILPLELSCRRRTSLRLWRTTQCWHCPPLLDGAQKKKATRRPHTKLQT